MGHQKNELLIYKDLTDVTHTVRYVETSPESGNIKVKLGEREIWLRPAQLQTTGRIYEPKEDRRGERKSWTIGKAVPEYAKKQKKKK